MTTSDYYSSLYRVRSSNGRDWYTVDLGRRRCDCKAGSFGQACSHLGKAERQDERIVELKHHTARVFRCTCRGAYRGHEYTCRPSRADLLYEDYLAHKDTVKPLMAGRRAA